MINILTQKSLKHRILLLILIVGISSCKSAKDVVYFKDVSSADSSLIQNTSTFSEPTIQPDDILSISIFTIDPSTSMVINQLSSQALGTSQNINTVNPSANGFLVDKNGEVEISVVGKVKLLGLTTFEARDLIRKKAALNYTNPNVQVRYSNFKITLLGEVNRPATYTVPNEKLTVLDAIGMAGDLTIYGKRENILLIRDNAGKKQMARLNLNSSSLFKSPYFYLKQNDVIYVEPHKGKTTALNAANIQILGVITSIGTLAVLILSRL